MTRFRLWHQGFSGWGWVSAPGTGQCDLASSMETHFGVSCLYASAHPNIFLGALAVAMETALEANVPMPAEEEFPQENGEIARLPGSVMGPLISEASKNCHF